jgi:hypothetical protein
MDSFEKELQDLDEAQLKSKQRQELDDAERQQKIASLITADDFLKLRAEIIDLPVGVASFLKSKNLEPNVTGKLMQGWSKDAKLFQKHAKSRGFWGGDGAATSMIYGRALGTDGIHYEISGLTRSPEFKKALMNDEKWYFIGHSVVAKEVLGVDPSSPNQLDLDQIDNFLLTAAPDAITGYCKELLAVRKAANTKLAFELLKKVPLTIV